MVSRPETARAEWLRALDPDGPAPGVGVLERPDVRESVSEDRPWSTVVWNDPVNLMTYVARVFRRYFGFSREEAQRRMLLVHTEGRAVVATGPREEMERHTEAMHEYGLWATVEKVDP